MARLREVRKIIAESKSGKPHVIIEYERVVTQRLLNGQTLTGGGAREWFLVDGRDVNQLSETRYQILENDEILNAIDTNE